MALVDVAPSARSVREEASASVRPRGERAVPEQVWAARTLAALLVLGGVMGLVGLAVPELHPADRLPKLLVSVLALGSAVLVGILPWGRWPRGRTAWLIPLFLAVVLLHRLAGSTTSLFPNHLFVAFAWIGVWHRTWTSLRWAVPAAAVYLFPLLAGRSPALALASTAVVIPACVGLGEITARVAARFREAREAARLIEARQWLMFRQMPAVVWSTDGDLRLTSAAGSALTSHDIAVDAMLGSNVFEVLGLTETAAAEASRRAAAGESATFETEFDGRIYEGRIDPLRDGAGDMVGTVGFAQDMTDHRRAERRARTSLSLLEAALDSTAEGVLVVDLAGRVVTSNARFAELWKIPREVIESGNDEAMIASVLEQLEAPEAFVRRIRELYASPLSESRDMIRFLDGRVFERVSRPQVLDGRPVGRVWSFRDVTDRVRNEDTLRRQADELEALHHTTLGLLDEVDAGEMLRPIVERAAELLGTDHAWVYAVEPETDELVVRVGTGVFTANLGYRLRKGDGLAGRVWESGRTMAVDDYGSWPGGRPEFARLHAVMGTPMRLRGRVIGVIGVASADPGRAFGPDEQALLSRFGKMASLALHHADLLAAAQSEIEERERSEEALRDGYEREREAAAQLRRLNEMKNAFLTAVSHELRTPLTSVVGYADTLERWHDTVTGEQREQMLGRLAKNARKLDRLLTDLLDVDRLTRGILKPNLKNAEIGGLVRSVVENADYLDGRPVTVETTSMVMKVDAPKVERIVENLLANAVRHTQTGTRIWIRSERVPQGALITVEDAGRGIPRHVADSIFEPFQQGPERREHSPGVGIGLSLVARFAEMHRGRAWVEARPGGGAAFKVLLREPAAHCRYPAATMTPVARPVTAT